MAKINKVLYNIDQRDDTTETEKKTARDNIGAIGASDVTSVDRTDIGNRTYDVEAIHFKQKGATTSQIVADSTDLGSTVPLPDMSADEGKVPVSYYRDGRGYYLLERIIPSHVSSDANKVLTVMSNNALTWADVPNVPSIKVWNGTTTVDKDFMTIYEGSSTGALAGITFNNENSTVTMVKNPTSNDDGKVLTAVVPGGSVAPYYEWSTPTTYSAGQGIDITNDQISWKYTVGRNLHINQNNQIQTNLPGGIYDAPTAMSNSFTALPGANFAGAFRLGCRYNTNGKYELALIYTASGTTSTITFIGTETVIGINNNITVNPAAYIGETAYYTPSNRFGYNTSTIFDPTIHKAIIYQGLAQIGPTSNTQIAIWQDNGSVKISFTSIEVGRVGSTL